MCECQNKNINNYWIGKGELLQKIDSLEKFMEGKQKDNSIYRMSSEELHNFWLDKIERLKEFLEDSSKKDFNLKREKE